jgi:hypothetical protein
VAYGLAATSKLNRDLLDLVRALRDQLRVVCARWSVDAARGWRFEQHAQVRRVLESSRIRWRVADALAERPRRAAYTRAIGLLDGIRRLLGGMKGEAEAVAEGEVPAATSQADDDRETSTNAQTSAASQEPWPGND